MLVLNNLPNVQILNGRSTKDEDDEEEDNGEGGGELADNIENDEINNHVMHNVNINNIYNNEITNRNNHLYPQMEEIEEDKNLEKRKKVEEDIISEDRFNKIKNILEEDYTLSNVGWSDEEVMRKIESNLNDEIKNLFDTDEKEAINKIVEIIGIEILDLL